MPTQEELALDPTYEEPETTSDPSLAPVNSSVSPEVADLVPWREVVSDSRYQAASKEERLSIAEKWGGLVRQKFGDTPEVSKRIEDLKDDVGSRAGRVGSAFDSFMKSLAKSTLHQVAGTLREMGQPGTINQRTIAEVRGEPLPSSSFLDKGLTAASDYIENRIKTLPDEANPRYKESVLAEVAEALGGSTPLLMESLGSGGAAALLAGLEAKSSAYTARLDENQKKGMAKDEAEKEAEQFSNESALLTVPQFGVFLGTGKIAANVANKLLKTAPTWARVLGTGTAATAANIAAQDVNKQLTLAHEGKSLDPSVSAGDIATAVAFAVPATVHANHATNEMAKNEVLRTIATIESNPALDAASKQQLRENLLGQIDDPAARAVIEAEYTARKTVSPLREQAAEASTSSPEAAKAAEKIAKDLEDEALEKEMLAREEAAKVKIDAAKLKSEPETVVSVPVMITKQMVGDLKARGITDAEIYTMTPQEANDILSKPVATPIEAKLEPTTTPAEEIPLPEKSVPSSETVGVTEAITEIERLNRRNSIIPMSPMSASADAREGSPNYVSTVDVIGFAKKQVGEEELRRLASERGRPDNPIALERAARLVLAMSQLKANSPIPEAGREVKQSLYDEAKVRLASPKQPYDLARDPLNLVSLAETRVDPANAETVNAEVRRLAEARGLSIDEQIKEPAKPEVPVAEAPVPVTEVTAERKAAVDEYFNDVKNYRGLLDLAKKYIGKRQIKNMKPGDLINELYTTALTRSTIDVPQLHKIAWNVFEDVAGRKQEAEQSRTTSLDQPISSESDITKGETLISPNLSPDEVMSKSEQRQDFWTQFRSTLGPVENKILDKIVTKASQQIQGRPVGGGRPTGAERTVKAKLIEFKQIYEQHKLLPREPRPSKTSRPTEATKKAEPAPAAVPNPTGSGEPVVAGSVSEPQRPPKQPKGSKEFRLDPKDVVTPRKEQLIARAEENFAQGWLTRAAVDDIQEQIAAAKKSPDLDRIEKRIDETRGTPAGGMTKPSESRINEKGEPYTIVAGEQVPVTTRQLVDMHRRYNFQGGIKGVLRSVGKISNRPDYRGLANLYSRIVNSETQIRLNSTLHTRMADGLFTPGKTNLVEINPYTLPHIIEEAILHEVGHELLFDKIARYERGDLGLSVREIKAIENLIQIRQELLEKFAPQDVMDFAKDHAGERPETWQKAFDKFAGEDRALSGWYYAMSNQEFVTGLTTNPHFQDVLRKLKTEGSTQSGQRTFWDRIVDVIGSLFGIQRGTGLHAGLKNTMELLRAKAKPALFNDEGPLANFRIRDQEPHDRVIQEKGRLLDLVQRTRDAEIHAKSGAPSDLPNLRDLVRQHFSKEATAAQSLAEQLEKVGGLDPQTAASLEQSFEKAINTQTLSKGGTMGIVAPGTAEIQQMIEHLTPAAKPLLPAMNFDTKSPLPDLQSYAVAKKVLGTGWGMERIPVLGRLFGGRGYAKTPVQKALATWAAENYGVGKSIASAVGSMLRQKISSSFVADKEGNLNVVRTDPKQSLKISDVFETLQDNPNAYLLSPHQREVWTKDINPLLKRFNELTKQYDLVNTPNPGNGEFEFQSYFPRIVLKSPHDVQAQGAGGKIGSKQSFQKSRAFKTEAEGWEKGYIYDTNVEARLSSSIEHLYKAMADHRLASDPELGGKGKEGLKNELVESYAEEILDGTMTEKDIDRMATGLESRGRVYQPAFAGKIFDADVAQTLNKAFPTVESTIRKAVVKGNNFVKGLALGFDLGVGQIQGLTLLLSSPLRPKNLGIWAKAQVEGLKELIKPSQFSEYANLNKEPIRELAQMGSSVSQLQEMLAGLERGQLVERIPFGVGKLARRFAGQFQTFLDVAKVELWKSYREITPKEEWPRVVQAVESMLGEARMESIGLKPARILSERALLLAPSYYRGAMNLIGGLAERGASGDVARRAMAGYLVGGSALFYGMAKALGMDDDEILSRFNPADRNFLQWRIKMSNGREVNLGIGGIYRSVIRLFGRMVRTSIEHPENWVSLEASKNPVMSFFRSHSSPGVAFAWDNFTGKDFLGRPTDLRRSFENFIPIWARQAVSKVEKEPATPLEYAANFFGSTGYGVGPEDQTKQLASDFKRQQGVVAPTGFSPGESPYTALEWALRTNQLEKAKTEYEKLLKKMEGDKGTNKSAKDRIDEHIQNLADETYTGSVPREKKFKKTLTMEQKRIYDLAHKENKNLPKRLQEARRLP